MESWSTARREDSPSGVAARTGAECLATVSARHGALGILLQSELLYLQKFESFDHFREKLEAYLKYYNEDRIKLKLDGLSPVQYRLLHQAKAS